MLYEVITIQYAFTGTVSRIEGLNFDDIAKEILQKHHYAYDFNEHYLTTGGFFQWNKEGEKHLLSPEVIHLLQQSAWKNDYQQYKQFAELVNSSEKISLRNLLKFRKRISVPLEEVESVTSILKRFSTGAMSFRNNFV